jgi:hypothetical protein
MNAGRTFRRTVRPLWLAGLVTAAWVNRARLRRALGGADGHPDEPIVASTEGGRVTRRTTTTAFVWPRRHSHRRTTLHGAATRPQPMSVVETIVTETDMNETDATS